MLQFSETDHFTTPSEPRFPFGFSPFSRAGEKLLEDLRQARDAARRAALVISGLRPGGAGERAQVLSVAHRLQEAARGLGCLIETIEGRRGDFTKY